jgi:signal peptidase I
MSGSGARDGFGSPPWGPADPVPELEDTQVLPGLGAIPGPGETSGWAGGANFGGANFGGANFNGDGRGGDGDAFGASSRPDQGWRAQGAQGAQDPGLRATRAERAIGDDRAVGNGWAFGGDRSHWDEGGERDAGGAADPDRPEDKKPAKRRSFWRELPVLVVVALVLALIIKSFAIQAFYIPTGSMQNTLAIGDRVLINKIVYHLRPIERGDIVVFDGNGSWDFNPPASSNIFSKAVDELEGIVGIDNDSSIYIKRVIGLPGDVVACCTNGKVTVNGVPLQETSYLYPGNQPSTKFGPVTVPAGRLWVMGDHRAVSYDSRGHMGDPGGGTIPESGVLGRAFVIIWPPSQWGFLNIPATFEQPKLNASSAAGGNAAAGGSSAVLAAALDNGTPIQPSNSQLPLALGFAGAIPITWLQRKARRRVMSRRRSHRPEGS